MKSHNVKKHRRSDSNAQPLVLETNALPIELRRLLPKRGSEMSYVVILAYTMAGVKPCGP